VELLVTCFIILKQGRYRRLLKDAHTLMSKSAYSGQFHLIFLRMMQLVRRTPQQPIWIFLKKSSSH